MTECQKTKKSRAQNAFVAKTFSQKKLSIRPFDQMVASQVKDGSRGRPIIGADIKHFTDIGHFQNRFADNFFFFFIMQTNILFTGDIIYW